jgi:hypothetical protein
MQPHQLTEIQKYWLDHINQATKQKLSMSDYAKQNNLVLKSFYGARALLTKKGVLSTTGNKSLLPINPSLNLSSSNAIQYASSCRVILCNGVIIDLTDVDITKLLNSATQL